MSDEEPEEIVEKKSVDVFSTDKTQDIISHARNKVMFRFADRNPQHMWEYLNSLIGIIDRHLPPRKDELEELMANPETKLSPDMLQLSVDQQWKWWRFLEGCGFDVDLHGYYKPKGSDLPEVIIQETPMVYNWNIIFGFLDMLYETGSVNVCIGAMKSGKSNMMLGLGLRSIQLGYFLLASNLGIQEGYEHPWIKRCTWMTELLRILCHNKIENIKYKKQGTPLKCMNVNITLDEGEAIMSSQSRSDDKSSGIFLKFIQFCRKLDSSLTFIYHDMNNFPSSMRESTNINAIVYKGIDKENKDLPNVKKEAIIDFPSRNYTMHMDDIQECELLETDEWSSFDIIDENHPDKSVTMKEIFKITKDKRAYEVPHAILRYLDNLTFENQPYENVLGMVRRIHNRIYQESLPHCEKSKQYETILRREIELTYKIADASKIRFSDKVIKKVASEEFDLFKIEKKKKEIDPETIDYKKCDFDLLVTFVTKNKPHKLKKIVGEDYREINNIEIRELLGMGVSKGRILHVYSYRVRKIDLFKDFEATLVKE